VLAPLQQPDAFEADLKSPSPAPEKAVCPLSAEERIRRRQLILVVERGLSQFLAVGAALLELRSSRLYRETHDTFESFCRETFGLARSTTDQVIRSASTAQLLLATGAELPANTSEAVIRPVSALPSAELQTATWQLIQAASPACGPTQPLASKICRTVRNAIEAPGNNGNGHKPRKREHPEREQSFISPVRRLSAYKGFDANLVLGHVEKFSSALSAFTACRIMAERCLTCCDILSKRFPELTDA
jgi:hypothetical protein